jgi:hypothetical protein
MGFLPFNINVCGEYMAIVGYIPKLLEDAFFAGDKSA